MAAIFLSYDRDDMPRIRQLVKRLEEAGHVVWWDQKIRVGTAIDQAIAASMAKSDCAIIAWSNHAAQSDWVRAEATRAKEQIALLPIRLDADASIPLPFNSLHTADLSDWDFQAPHAEFERLLGDLRTLPTRPRPGAEVTAASSSAQVSKRPVDRKRLRLVALIMLPTLIGAVAALVAMYWRLPTKIEATLPICVARVSVPNAGVPLLDAQSLSSVALERLARASFAPVEVKPAGEAATACWLRAVAFGRENMLTGKGFSLVAGDERNPVMLQAINLNSPGEITVEKIAGCQASGHAEAGLRVQLPKQNLYISPSNVLHLNARSPSLEGTRPGCSTDAIELQAKLAPGNPYLEVEGSDERMAIVLSPTAQREAISLLGANGARLSSIELTRQDGVTGRPVSSLEGDGEIRYPGYKQMDSKRIAQHEIVRIAGTTGRIRYDPKGNQLLLKLHGEATEFRSRSIDYRMSAFERLWYGNMPAALLVIGTWLAAVTAGALKLYKDFHR